MAAKKPAPKRKRGRKATPDDKKRKIVEAVCKEIQSGISKVDAGHLAGVSPPTLRKWLDEDPELLAIFKKAEAELKVRWIAEADELSHTGNRAGWQWYAWKLERRFAEWRREAKDKDDTPAVKVELVGIDVSKI